MKVIILGKEIGEAEGWDQVTDQGIKFYSYEGDVKELDGYDFFFDWTTGLVEAYDEEEGDVVGSYDYKILM